MGQKSVALSVGTPLCSYGVAYRSIYGLCTCGLFKKSLSGPLCGAAVSRNVGRKVDVRLPGKRHLQPRQAQLYLTEGVSNPPLSLPYCLPPFTTTVLPTVGCMNYPRAVHSTNPYVASCAVQLCPQMFAAERRQAWWSVFCSRPLKN